MGGRYVLTVMSLSGCFFKIIFYFIYLFILFLNFT